MTTNEIRSWAEKYGDIHDVMDRVEPQHIVWLANRCDLLAAENEILRSGLQKIIAVSHEKSGIRATGITTIAEADDVCGDNKKL